MRTFDSCWVVTAKLENSTSKEDKMFSFLKRVVSVMGYKTSSFQRCSLLYKCPVCSVALRLGSRPQGKHRTPPSGLCATWNGKSSGEKSETAWRGTGARNGLPLFRTIKFGGNSTTIVDLAGSFTFDREEKMKDSESSQVLVAEGWTGNPSGGAFLLRERRWRSAPGRASWLQVPRARR